MPKTKKNLTVLSTAATQVQSVAESLRLRLRSKPRRFYIGGAVVLLGLVAVGLMTWRGLPDWEAIDQLQNAVGAQASLPELMKRAKENPKDASIQLDLGHAYFAAQKHKSALAAYDRALALDKSVASGRLIDNLLACYGKDEQGAAHAILVQYKLTHAEAGLRQLVDNARWSVRTGAMDTLERLGKATREDAFTVWMLDLKSPDCDVKRHAVEKLGELGDKRALDAIRAAKKKDDEETPWYAFSCIGGRAEDAQNKILAKR
ncbi:MAG: hypothetical protein ACOZIN_12165 [Myxococcota bacterium]